MESAPFDAIGLVERAYNIDLPDAEWLRAIVTAAAPSLERGFGMFIMAFGPQGFAKPIGAEIIGPPKLTALSAKLMSTASPEVAHAFTSLSGVATMRGILAEIGSHEIEAWDRTANPVGIRDMIGVLAHDGEDGALNLAAFSAHDEHLDRIDVRRWMRIGSHLGAALRVRRRHSTLQSRVEAVLTTRGRVEDVSGSLHHDRSAREALADGARNMMRARGRLRRDDDQALDLWHSMVGGRWTLVEHVDTDRKVTLEAHENLPRRRALADLTPRERAVVELARRGHGNKQIAYALGLAVGTVGATLSSAMKKAGVATRVELIALGRSPSVDAVERALGADATRAEIDVAVLAAAGLSNAEIAARRGVSARTIANQIARIFERAGVSSRGELAAYVQAHAQPPAVDS